jgi:hypothetical protein
MLTFYGTDASGNKYYIDPDGNVVDSDGNSVDDLSGINSIAMTTSTPAPTVNPSSAANARTSGTIGLLNSAGQFGTALTSLLTGKPIVATVSGKPVGAVGSQVLSPPGSISMGTILLIGLGVFLIIKLAK